ncbi:MAG: YqjD family protein [Planctomycetota bacterium]
MSAPRSRVRSELDELRDDLGALRTDVRNLVVALRDAGEGSIHKLSRAAGRVAENGAARVSEAEESAREGIQQHPWWSVFGALGVGLLVGRFLDRS